MSAVNYTSTKALKRAIGSLTKVANDASKEAAAAANAYRLSFDDISGSSVEASTQLTISSTDEQQALELRLQALSKSMLQTSAEIIESRIKGVLGSARHVD